MENQDQQNRDDVHRTIRTMSLGTLWRMLRYPFILLSMAFIPRMMGDSDYGKYAYFMSVFVILDMMTDLGFLQVFGRFVPESEASGKTEHVRGILHGVMAFGLLLAGLLSAAFVLYHAFRPVPGFGFEWVVLLVLMLLLTRIEGTLFSFLYGLNQIARFSSKEVFRSALTLLLVLSFYWKFGLSGALWALVVNELILSVLGVVWTKEHLFQPWRYREIIAIKPYLIFGIKFYLPALLFGLLQRSGNVFVQHLGASTEEVAYYDIANQFLLLTATFLGIILQTLLPALTKLHLGNDAKTIQRWQGTIMTYCAALSFLSFNALMWLGEPVVAKWLGDSFLPVIPNAWIMAIAIVPVLIAYAGMNYSLLDKTPGVYTCAVGLGIAVMAVACFVLVPGLGSIGASWATILGYSTLGAVFMVKYHRFYRHILKGFLCAILVGIAFVLVHEARDGLLVSTLWFCGTSVGYVSILFLLRIVRLADLRKIRDAFARRKVKEPVI